MGNDYEKVDVEGLDVTIAHHRGAEDGDARARVARRSASARRPHRAAEGAASAPIAATISCARCRSRFRPTPAARCRCSSPTARGWPGRTARSALAAAAQRRPDDQGAQQGAPQQHALRQAARLATPAPSSTASCCRRCRRRCSACSKATATAAPSTRCTARRSANGNCRPSTRSRLAHADDHRLAELIALFHLC